MAPELATAIGQAVAADADRGFVDLDAEAAVVALYAWKESRLRRNPYPISWDSAAGVSCDFLQMPCNLIRGQAPVEQVRMWLSWMHDAGLGSLDSSPTRAAHRVAQALALLARAEITQFE
jgi:hypothetical protein